MVVSQPRWASDIAHITLRRAFLTQYSQNQHGCLIQIFAPRGNNHVFDDGITAAVFLP
nr:MAG TPA: hypothetical protein [Caudoviricetes sp.]